MMRLILAVFLVLLVPAAALSQISLDHAQGTIKFPTYSVAPATNGQMGFDGTVFKLFESGSLAGVGSRATMSGTFRGLKAIWNSGAIVNITADKFTVSDPTSVTSLSNVSVSPNAATAGPAANGRDQVGAFTNESWIYGYVIYNGTTTAGLWSASDTTPTLPSGYTHFGLATIARHVAPGTVRDFVQVGKTVRYYQGYHTILNNGAATSWTVLSAAAFIPPRSRLGMFNVAWLNTSAAGHALYMGGDGTQIFAEVVTQNVGAYIYDAVEGPITSSQQVYYYLSTATGSQAYIYVRGYNWE